MRDGKQQAKITVEIKFSPRQLQCGDWKVYRLPGVSQKVRSRIGRLFRAFCQQPAPWRNILRTPKNWGWQGRKGSYPRLYTSFTTESTTQRNSQLSIKRLKVIEVCKDRLFSEQGLLKWHRGLLYGVYQWVQTQWA